jgi:hypothetical protein
MKWRGVIVVEREVDGGSASHHRDMIIVSSGGGGEFITVGLETIKIAVRDGVTTV